MVNKNAKLRFIIYGAGAIGGAVGSHLFMAGKDVILIGRSYHVNRINENGLKFTNPHGTRMLKLRAVTSPRQIDFQANDVILLCVKSQDTEAALSDLKALIPDIPVFCIQNGIRNEETAVRFFPRVYGAMIRIGGEYIADGEITVRRDPPGWLVMSRYPSGKDALLESVADNLRDGGFLVMTTDNVMPYKWGKLMANLANAIGAITNAREKETREITEATRQEAENILKQAGIRWISAQDLEKEWTEVGLPPRGILSTESQSSTWQSLFRRQGNVETEFLNGEIVRLAKQIGQEAPINQALVRITQEMASKREQPGKYTPAEFAKILGIR
jgi:2-dehydropantoate 2-reductase